MPRFKETNSSLKVVTGGAGPCEWWHGVGPDGGAECDGDMRCCTTCPSG